MKKIASILLISIAIFTSCNNENKENKDSKATATNTPNVSTACFSADYEKSFEGVIS